jgi:spore germination protein KA
MKDIASKELVDQVKCKLESIDIDDVFDSNYLIESISNDKKNAFPIYISSERPDLVSMHLLEGRIALVVENTPYVIIIPALLVDFFHSPEDFYQKVTNVNFTRFIRVVAFLISVLAPAIYVAMSTYNIEAIPAKLLLNFSTQRAGVPLPTILEVIMMIVTFEILRESDTRLPSAIGSSLSVVGALVLGQAAVAAGIVSAITIIVTAVTAISSLICTSVDVINGIRWWRLIFLLFAAFAGIYGIVVAGYIFLIKVASMKSFGLPYLTPIAPLFVKEHNNAIFITNKRKFNERSQLTAKSNIERQVNK